MTSYVTPNETLRDSDAKSIAAAVALAAARGVAVRIPRENARTGKALWEIDESIALPSNTEILFDGAHLRLADGCVCNMFTAIGGSTVSEALTNIHLHGRDGAELDGGVHNGLCERNSELEGRAHISKNTTLLFANVQGLCVEDLTLSHQRWWAITNVAVREARFSRLHFNAHLARVDATGVLHADEWPQHYREMYVHNADGIDLRVGCHNVLIEDITGFTGDDTVALTALGGFERRLSLLPTDADPDIHDVLIRRVDTETFACAGVRLLNHNGNKLYRVTVEDVTLRHREGVLRSHAAVSIGDKNYATTVATAGDTHHITVRRVRSEAAFGVSLCGFLQDSVIAEISAAEGLCAVGVRPQCTAHLERCHILASNLCHEGLTLTACTQA